MTRRFPASEGPWRLGVWDKNVLKKYKTGLRVKTSGAPEDCGRPDSPNPIEAEGGRRAMTIPAEPQKGVSNLGLWGPTQVAG